MPWIAPSQSWFYQTTATQTRSNLPLTTLARATRLAYLCTRLWRLMIDIIWHVVTILYVVVAVTFMSLVLCGHVSSWFGISRREYYLRRHKGGGIKPTKPWPRWSSPISTNPFGLRNTDTPSSQGAGGRPNHLRFRRFSAILPISQGIRLPWLDTRWTARKSLSYQNLRKN